MDGARMSRKGFSMIELTIVAAIMAVIFFMCLLVTASAQRLSSHCIFDGQMQEQNRIIVSRLARELRYTGTGSPDFDMAADTNLRQISFRRSNGYDTVNKVPTWGNLITYRLKAVPGSGEDYSPGIGENYVNGIDDNQNGVLDEGGLYRTEAGVSETLVGRDVVASEFIVRRTGRMVTIRIGLSKPDPSSKEQRGILRGTFETSVFLRD